VPYLNIDIPVNKITREIHDKNLDSWSIVTIENIVSEDGNITYGLTSDEKLTGKPCRTKWFSATDFTLTRTGDLPAKSE